MNTFDVFTETTIGGRTEQLDNGDIYTSGRRVSSKIGTAVKNEDGSIAVSLDALPASGNLTLCPSTHGDLCKLHNRTHAYVKHSCGHLFCDRYWKSCPRCFGRDNFEANLVKEAR